MALDPTKLERIGGGGVSQLWIYKTPDTVATVTAAGYFNTVYAMLRQFDVIMVVGTTGGTATIDNCIVTSATGATAVTTASVEGVTAT